MSGSALRVHHVGVRRLKAQLSACLKLVRSGERLTVTDRGRPVATIVPVDEPASVAWAHAIVAGGRARWSGGRPAGLTRRRWCSTIGAESGR